MFIGYIRHYKSDKEITYIKIASIWSDLVARGMFISLIKSKVLDSRWDILNHKIKFWILKFYSCKNFWLRYLSNEKFWSTKEGVLCTCKIFFDPLVGKVWKERFRPKKHGFKVDRKNVHLIKTLSNTLMDQLFFRRALCDFFCWEKLTNLEPFCWKFY